MKILEWLAPLWNTAKTVIPLAALLAALQFFALKRPLDDVKSLVYGLALTVVGLHLFMKGASLSLVPLGSAVGQHLYRLGHPLLIMAAGFVVGYAATLVEPALRDVASQVQEVSVGVISARMLSQVVAVGFGCGMALGLWRLVRGVGFLPVMLPLLALLALGVAFAPKPFGSIALDAASATTGPVNIPVNLALALGLSQAIEGLDPLTAGFGLVGLTSCASSLAVILLGLLSRFL